MSELGRCVAWVLVSLCLLATGCIGLSKAYPEKRMFALEAPACEATKNPPLEGVLRVNALRVGPLYEGNDLVYRTGDVEYESDFYNQWFVPPGLMLTSAFEMWFRSAGLFEHVVTTAVIDANLVLAGLVTALHGDYRTQPPKAVLGMEIYLASEELASKIFYHRSCRQEVELANGSAEALVRGLNEALRLILIELERDLRKLEIR